MEKADRQLPTDVWVCMCVSLSVCLHVCVHACMGAGRPAPPARRESCNHGPLTSTFTCFLDPDDGPLLGFVGANEVIM